MNWDDYRFVLAISRAGSLLGASRTLGVDQTTVGRRLSALERRLGTALFFRRRRGFVLTEAGETILAGVERIETESLRLEDLLGAAIQRPTGVVRVATMPWIFNTILIPGLPVLRARFPGVVVQAIGGLRERAISNREAELALRFEMEPRGATEHRLPVGTVHYAVYARRGQPLEDLPWVGHWDESASYAPDRWLSDRLTGQPEEVAFRGNDAGLLHTAVRNGLGKGLLPVVLAADDPEVVRISGESPELSRQLNVLVHRNIETLARVKVTIDWIRDILAPISETT